MNKSIGNYKSVNDKVNWSEVDPLLFDIATERLQKIEDKVTEKFEKERKEHATN